MGEGVPSGRKPLTQCYTYRMPSIANLSGEPVYPIRVACAQVGVPPVTLRAWERRYQVLSPQRGGNRYRLYSERDVALLRWVKSRVDAGLPISRAVQELKRLQERGEWPEPVETLPPFESLAQPKPPQAYTQALFQALKARDETRARDIYREANAFFDLVTLCTKVISPCLVEIGEAWERGDILITVEHFASAFIRGRLLALFQAYPLHRSGRSILVGCAEGELHEIGSLMMAMLLRHTGYEVEYLGADLPTEDLVEHVVNEKPAMVCMSATLPASARQLISLQARLANRSPATIFAFGGRAFDQDVTLRSTIPGIFLGEDLPSALAQVARLLR